MKNFQPFLKIDVRGDIGGVRELIADYIINVKGGKLTIPDSEDGRTTNVKSITVNDLQ